MPSENQKKQLVTKILPYVTQIYEVTLYVEEESKHLYSDTAE